MLEQQFENAAQRNDCQKPHHHAISPKNNGTAAGDERAQRESVCDERDRRPSNSPVPWKGFWGRGGAAVAGAALAGGGALGPVALVRNRDKSTANALVLVVEQALVRPVGLESPRFHHGMAWLTKTN